MILTFCNKSYIMEIMLIVKTFFKIACYLAPLLIIIVSSINIFKVITTGKEEELKESINNSIKRIIAGILIFFFPTLINYIFTGIVDVQEVEFLSCFQEASKEKVASLKAKEESAAEAEKKQQEKEDEVLLRKAYEEEQKKRDANKKSFEEWKKEKEEEERRQQQQQQSAGGGSTLPSGTITPVKVGENGVNVKKFSAGGVNMNYYEITPANVTSNLPIIIFLHGSGETGSVSGVGGMPIVSYVANHYTRSNQNFIFLAPVAPSSGWSGNNAKAVKAIIDATITQYNADRSRIYLTGMSMGGYGTWNMVATYGNYFAAAMPMSGCSSSYNANNYVSIPIYAIVGSSESECKSCMNNIVNKINSSGGHAVLDVVNGASHSTIQRYYQQEKIFDWLLSQ